MSLNPLRMTFPLSQPIASLTLCPIDKSWEKEERSLPALRREMICTKKYGIEEEHGQLKELEEVPSTSKTPRGAWTDTRLSCEQRPGREGPYNLYWAFGCYPGQWGMALYRGFFISVYKSLVVCSFIFGPSVRATSFWLCGPKDNKDDASFLGPVESSEDLRFYSKTNSKGVYLGRLFCLEH